MIEDVSELNVGFISLARTTFDMELAGKMTEQARRTLSQDGIRLIGPQGMVTDMKEAEAALKALTAGRLDLLVVLQATFADSTMLIQLAERIDAPLLLWALPESGTGGRLRLNSFCGINLGAHGLKRRGFSYYYIYLPPESAGALKRTVELGRAGRVKHLLRTARIGRIGRHPEGFDSCAFSAEALKARLGVEVVQIDLDRVFSGARQADPEKVEALVKEFEKKLEGLAELDQKAVRGTLSAYLSLKRIAEEEKLDGLAVRCWPQFFTDLGCAACGAMSILSNELIPCSCEADINGTVTQLILQWLGGEPAFGSDLVSIDPDQNQAVLWHCGLAPLSMADPSFRPRATVHSNRQMPLLMEFPLKPGRVTVARLSETEDEYRLVSGAGLMLEAPLSFSGTSGVIRFDRPAAQVLDTIIGQGLEHHVSLVYGDHTASLSNLAELLDLPVLHL